MHTEDEELIFTKNHNNPFEVSNGNFFTRNKKAIIITSFILVILIVLLVPTIMYATRKKVNTNYFTFSDMITSRYNPRSNNVRWLNGENGYIYNSNGNLIFLNLDTGLETVILNSTLIRETHAFSYSGYIISPNNQRFLLYNNYSKLWRHSFLADYYVYSAANNTLEPLSNDKNFFSNALFSPDSSKVAFVYNNNIFVKDLDTGVETQVTTNGSPDNIGGEIKNGVQSWVYEEEIFGDYSSIWFSPDSNKITYFCSNETLVPVYSFPIYKLPYNQDINVKYPKAGYPNPVVDVFVFELDTKNITQVDLGSDPDYLILSVKWRDANNCYVRKSDRFQTQEQVLKVTVGSATPQVVNSYGKNNGWLSPDLLQQMFFIDGGAHYIDLRENNNYIQMGVYDSETGALVRWLTNEQAPVEAIISYVASQNLIYFQRSDTPTERSVYTIKTDGTALTKLNKEGGTFSASVSGTGDYYLLVYSGNGDYLSVPTYTLYHSDHTVFRVLQDNADLRSALALVNLPSKIYFEDVVSADGKYKLNGRIIYPPNFDKKKKYTTLLYVYGGPGSQNVRKSFSLGFDEYLASQGIIVACVDGRGTGHRSVEFEQSVYLQLGVLETEDQIQAAKYLKKLSYVDKLGIYGWSYGGYMSSRVITDNTTDLFDYAISVAPVTDWRLYDTVYTERYMRSPQVNPDGYNISSNLHQAGNLRAPLLLVHGSADDNVHYQNSNLLALEFIKHNVQFDDVYYPNSDHSISLGNARGHLYTRMLNFINQVRYSDSHEH